MQASIKLEGDHIDLATEDEIFTAINAASSVFEQHQVDPLACAVAYEKFEKDEPLSKEEALLYVIWNTADDKAFHAVTLNWLVRDVDIRLAVSPAS